MDCAPGGAVACPDTVRQTSKGISGDQRQVPAWPAKSPAQPGPAPEADVHPGRPRLRGIGPRLPGLDQHLRPDLVPGLRPGVQALPRTGQRRAVELGGDGVGDGDGPRPGAALAVPGDECLGGVLLRRPAPQVLVEPGVHQQVLVAVELAVAVQIGAALRSGLGPAGLGRRDLGRGDVRHRAHVAGRAGVRAPAPASGRPASGGVPTWTSPRVRRLTAQPSHRTALTGYLPSAQCLRVQRGGERARAVHLQFLRAQLQHAHHRLAVGIADRRVHGDAAVRLAGVHLDLRRAVVCPGHPPRGLQVHPAHQGLALPVLQGAGGGRGHARPTPVLVGD